MTDVPPGAGPSVRNAEEARLRADAQREANWERWGPYLAERQWATVREDYSPDGSPWTYFPHDHARSRAYRWGEDGLLGICDRECRLCFALALWNGRDPILKERLFGLTNPEGNHGEDVKEYYFYLDATPTYSYLKGLYKYPQGEFPYSRLRDENRQRGRDVPEFELADTGCFDESRYFDVAAEYAKAAPDDILIRITVINRGSVAATPHILPTLWFRNTWSWGCQHEGCWSKPSLRQAAPGLIAAEHETLGPWQLALDTPTGCDPPSLLFTENETNTARLYAFPNPKPFVKDAFHEYVVHGRRDAVNPAGAGTKAAAHYAMEIPPGGAVALRLRLFAGSEARPDCFDRHYDTILAQRIAEADEFYRFHLLHDADAQTRQVARQAFAGLLWSKQFYQYIVRAWLDGDPAQPPPPPERRAGRNADWVHLYNRDVVLVPDKWEYPWYASWDHAFETVALAPIDPQFAKQQLILFLREWYMHPNGKLPAYEFCFDDVNPPVHAWACWRVYKMTGARGARDRLFLERVFHKLLITFTWWVNRKDISGKHLFAGGFLGLDNVSVFDRSQMLPGGAHLQQADGTAWMAFYCTTMLGIALELAREDPAYEDVASKFFEHFVAIADAINLVGGTGLWDDDDGFYYDQVETNGQTTRLRIRSLVGLAPLLAVEVLDEANLEKLPGFRKRMQWFVEHRPDLHANVICLATDARGRRRRLLAVPTRPRLERVLRRLLDEEEFLSPHGIRSLSRYHCDHPYVGTFNGIEARVHYAPGESPTAQFGGNSNWRGPVWVPLNYLLIEALERYHHFYGDQLRVEFPTGSGQLMNLQQVACQLALRLVGLFRRDEHGRRPCDGDDPRFANDPHWRDLVLFSEYFHGDTGRGLGASHQTGWTALVTRLMQVREPSA